MAYAKILAPLTGGARDASVLATAFAAAKPFNAHVEALFVRPDPTQAMPFFGEGVSGQVLQEIIDSAKQAAVKAAKEAHEALVTAVQSAGLALTEGPVRTEAVTVSWREREGNFADQITQESKLSDLVVFGRLSSDEKPGVGEAFEAALMNSGRPVLLSAQVPSDDFTRHIAIGWDGSMASARAVSAALPYLKRAGQTEVLTIVHGETPDGFQDICEYLALHGVKAGHRAIDSGTRPTGQVLLESAAASGASLLVLGGYGHPRLMQMLFGGVTRHIVSHAQLPLFLVH